MTRKRNGSAKNQRLLECLRKDPCQTQAQLSSALDLARETIRQQLEALRADGALQGRGYVLTDRARRTATKCILVSVHNNAIKEATFEELLRSIPMVICHYLVTGQFDYLVLINDADQQSEFRSVIGQIRAHEAVQNAVTLVIVP